MGKVIELAMAARYPPYTTANLSKFRALIGRSPNFKRPKNPHQVPTHRSVSSSLSLTLLSLQILSVLSCMRSRTGAMAHTFSFLPFFFLHLNLSQSSPILRRLTTILALVAIILGARSRGLITAF